MAREKLHKELFEYDSELRREYPVICGVDEAGRGPLAGPVFAAAVILPLDFEIEGINDSKKLSAKKREQLFDEITKNAIAYSIQSCDNKVISGTVHKSSTAFFIASIVACNIFISSMTLLSQL